jgi:hypothetical protein
MRPFRQALALGLILVAAGCGGLDRRAPVTPTMLGERRDPAASAPVLAANEHARPSDPFVAAEDDAEAVRSPGPRTEPLAQTSSTRSTDLFEPETPANPLSSGFLGFAKRMGRSASATTTAAATSRRAPSRTEALAQVADEGEFLQAPARKPRGLSRNLAPTLPLALTARTFNDDPPPQPPTRRISARWTSSRLGANDRASKAPESELDAAPTASTGPSARDAVLPTPRLPSPHLPMVAVHEPMRDAETRPARATAEEITPSTSTIDPAELPPLVPTSAADPELLANGPYLDTQTQVEPQPHPQPDPEIKHELDPAISDEPDPLVPAVAEPAPTTTATTETPVETKAVEPAIPASDDPAVASDPAAPSPAAEEAPEAEAEPVIDDLPPPLTSRSDEGDEADAGAEGPVATVTAPSPPPGSTFLRAVRSIDHRARRAAHRPEGLPPVEFPQTYYGDNRPAPPIGPAPRVSIARRLVNRVQSWTPPWHRGGDE